MTVSSKTELTSNKYPAASKMQKQKASFATDAADSKKSTAKSAAALRRLSRKEAEAVAASIEASSRRPTSDGARSFRLLRLCQQLLFIAAFALFSRYGSNAMSPRALLSSFIPSSLSSPFYFALGDEMGGGGGSDPRDTFHGASEGTSGGLPVEAQIVLAIVLICLTAVFAGLTIGIMGVGTLTLEIIAEGGTEPDCSYAKTLLPVRKMGHHALATLVLGNMWANVMIAQFCADVNPEGGGHSEGEESGGIAGFLAFAMSTLIILIFGEILPMSICKSSQALRIAAAGVPLLKVFIVLLYPIAKPLGLMLDYMVHHSVGQIYDRQELMELMKLHASRLAAESGLDTDEGNILVGVLEFKEKTIGAVMTRIEDTICVSEDCIIDRRLLKALWAVGRSRVPVVRGSVGSPIAITDPRSAVSLEMKQHIVGILYIKDLITYNVPNTTVGQYLRAEQQREVRHVIATDTLPKAMALAQTGVAHMFVVRDPPPTPSSSSNGGLSLASPSSVAYSNAASLLNNHVASPLGASHPSAVGGALSLGDAPLLGRVVGICTMEDVLEALIKSQIYDENDDDDALEAAEEMAEIGAATGQSPAAMRRAKATRVNLYSFHIDPEEAAAGGSSAADKEGSPSKQKPKPLTEVERNAIAKYLRNTIPAFAFWSLAALRALLAEAIDEVIMPIAPTTTSSSSSQPATNERGALSSSAVSDFSASDFNVSRETTTAADVLGASARSALAAARATAAVGTVGAVPAGDAFMMNSQTSQQQPVPASHVIARQGEPLNEFVLVLTGCVETCFGADGFRSEITTMGFLAESVLMAGKPFVPAFSAKVGRRPTRLLRVSIELYQRHERLMQIASSTSASGGGGGGAFSNLRTDPAPPPSLLGPIVTRTNPTGGANLAVVSSTTAGDNLPRPQYVSRYAASNTSTPASPTPLVVTKH